MQRTGTLGQFVPKYSGFGELPNKHFCGPCALQKFRSVATPELLAKTRNPQHGAKNGGYAFFYWEYIKFLTNTENTAYFAAETGYIPVRVSAQEDPVFAKVLEEDRKSVV